MDSTKALARRAGLLYFLMSILMVYGYMYASKFFAGDAATTARKIAENELFYRGTILISLVAQILFVFVVLYLYRLFRDVNAHLARLMVCLVCIGVAGEVVNAACRMAPLLLAGNSDFQSAFTESQRVTLGDGVLVLVNNLARFLTAFWGLWLIPFGILTIQSGFFPRVLGFLLMAAGLGYMVTCVAYILLPAILPTIAPIAFPLYFGELAMVLWLLVMGAKDAPLTSRTP